MTKKIIDDESEREHVAIKAPRPRQSRKHKRPPETAMTVAFEKTSSKIAADTDNTTTASLDKAYPRDPKYAEFFGFERRDQVFSFDDQGHLISRKLVWPGEPEVARVERKQFQLPFKVQELDGLPFLPPGLFMIAAPTKGGKSSLTKFLMSRMPVKRLRVVEPQDDEFDLVDTPVYSSADGALAAAIAATYADDSVLYALDSLRAPLFETSGAAGSKGVIMPFFTQLTRVSNQLASAGMTVIATINPMDDDEDYVKRFRKFLSASVPAMLWIERTEVTGKGRRWFGTLEIRPKRDEMVPYISSAEDQREDEIPVAQEIVFEPQSAASAASRIPFQLARALERTTA